MIITREDIRQQDLAQAIAVRESLSQLGRRLAQLAREADQVRLVEGSQGSCRSDVSERGQPDSSLPYRDFRRLKWLFHGWGLGFGAVNRDFENLSAHDYLLEYGAYGSTSFLYPHL